MSRRLYTVQNLINEVKSLIDETNQDSVSDTDDILPALNRAQDYATEILAKKYEDPLITYKIIDIGAENELDLPEDMYSDRVEKVEFTQGSGRFIELQRVSYRDLTNYEYTESNVAVPDYYAVVGRKIRFVPRPSGTFDVRMWYLRQPEDMVKPQGRITRVDAASNRVTVDAVGSGLSTEIDELESFVNVVDGQTGEVKATLQIKTISSNSIIFKSSLGSNPLLDSDGKLLNRTISTDLSAIFKSDGTTLAVEPNDYLCGVGGTCVPFFSRPLGNFLIQYAYADIKGSKLDGEQGIARQVLEKFEQQVERTWAGRENTLRVKKRSSAWGSSRRRVRWYPSEGSQ